MPIRIGAIGLGALGTISTRILDEREDVRIVAGVDTDPDARSAFETDYAAASYGDTEALLSNEELDAASIVTPHTLHARQIRACLEAGVSVHVEKPMVTDLADAVVLCDLADEHEPVLQVGYQRHFHPRFRELKRLVDDGRIGTPHMVSCHLEQAWLDAVGGSWRTDPDLSGGGQLYDSGSHLLDALLWVTGSRPVSVAATTDRRGERVDVNSALAATLERDGEPITASIGVTGAGSTGPDTGEGLFVWGTEGAVEYDGGCVRVREGDVAYETGIEDPSFEALTRRKLASFLRAVRGEEPPAVGPEVGLRITALTEAAYEAAETGRTVDIEGRIAAARDRTP